MKTQVLFRKVHHWGSIVIAPVLIVMIGAGILLMVKKEFDWLQPPTKKGVSTDIPAITIADMFKAAQAVPEAGLTSWSDLDRVDIKPDKGVVKFIGTNDWEVQVDTTTGEVLQVAFRRSDIIEKIHDGTFFAEGAKLYLFLPAGVGLLTLWLTGVYLFALTEIKKAQKRKKKAGQAGS